MSRKSTHHRPCYLPSEMKRNLSTLSRKTANLLRPSRSQKIVTKRKGQRFSLESQASLAEFLRLLQREPVLQWEPVVKRESDPRLGLHATCPFCEGFVVRNGKVRNCQHQRESWSSFLFEKREFGRGLADRDGSRETGSRFVGLGRMGAIPSVLRPGHGRFGRASSRGKGSIPSVLRPGHGRIGKATLRGKGSIPSILRPGHGRFRKATMPGAVSLSASPPSRPPRPATSAAYEVSSVVRHTEAPAMVDQALLKPGALMQQWKRWSRGWEQSVATITGKAALTGKAAVSLSAAPPARPPRPASTAPYEVSRFVQRTGRVAKDDRPPFKPNVLMQQWSEWSKGWEQSVGTINADAIPDFVSSADEAVDKNYCRRGGKPCVSLGLDINGVPESRKSVDLDSREQPHRNPDTLMQDWREWSVGWQRRVKSR